MDNLYEIGLLIDFYGELLTGKQREVLDLHFNCDLSLAEISEHMKISRQGVHDNIRRGKNTLYRYEEKLGFVRRFMEIRKGMEEVKTLLEQIKRNEGSSMDKALSRIREITDSIINKC